MSEGEGGGGSVKQGSGKSNDCMQRQQVGKEMPDVGGYEVEEENIDP